MGPREGVFDSGHLLTFLIFGFPTDVGNLDATDEVNTSVDNNRFGLKITFDKDPPVVGTMLTDMVRIVCSFSCFAAFVVFGDKAFATQRVVLQ